jgi:hypothetical protein
VIVRDISMTPVAQVARIKGFGRGGCAKVTLGWGRIGGAMARRRLEFRNALMRSGSLKDGARLRGAMVRSSQSLGPIIDRGAALEAGESGGAGDDNADGDQENGDAAIEETFEGGEFGE